MGKKLKPANENPDFSKGCHHGSLKGPCYVCELEAEITHLHEIISELEGELYSARMQD